MKRLTQTSTLMAVGLLAAMSIGRVSLTTDGYSIRGYISLSKAVAQESNGEGGASGGGFGADGAAGNDPSGAGVGGGTGPGGSSGSPGTSNGGVGGAHGGSGYGGMGGLADGGQSYGFGVTSTVGATPANFSFAFGPPPGVSAMTFIGLSQKKDGKPGLVATYDLTNPGRPPAIAPSPNPVQEAWMDHEQNIGLGIGGHLSIGFTGY